MARRSYHSAMSGLFIDDFNHSIFGTWTIKDSGVVFNEIVRYPFRREEINDFLRVTGFEYKQTDYYHYDLDEDFLYPKVVAHYGFIHEFFNIRECVITGWEKLSVFNKKPSQLFNINPCELYYLIGSGKLSKTYINNIIKSTPLKQQDKLKTYLTILVKEKDETKTIHKRRSSTTTK